MWHIPPFSKHTKQKNMKLPFFALFTMCHLCLMSQPETKVFKIVDGADGKPLSYVYLRIERNDTLLFVGQTSATGLFTIAPGNFPQDATLEIRHIGYTSKTYPISGLPGSETDLLKMSIDPTYLEEVRVFAERPAGKTKARATGAKDKKEDLGRRQAFGSELATYIDLRKRDEKGVLTKVRIKMSRKTQNSYPFRIHFYKAQGSYELPPLERVLTLNETFYSAGPGEWVEVDLTGYGIPLTEDGLYVSFECLPTEDLVAYEVVDYDGCVRQVSHMSVAAYHVGKKFLLWKRSYTKPDWERTPMFFMYKGKRQFLYRAQPVVRVQYMRIKE